MTGYLTYLYVECCLLKGYSVVGCWLTLEIQHLIVLFSILHSTFHHIE